MDIYKEKMKLKDMTHSGLILFGYSVTLTLSFLILCFFRFHVKLVMINTTTIESLDKANIESNRKVTTLL